MFGTILRHPFAPRRCRNARRRFTAFTAFEALMLANAANAPAKTAQKPAPAADLGPLPEWDLRDLYPSIDAPQVQRDLDRADAECVAFEESYRGKLAAIAASVEPGRTFAEAVERYESIDELLGRLDSYAGLLYAGNTIDPARAKFYGDVRDRLTAASSHLLFFTLELNRVEDATLEPALADPRLARYRPWFEDIRKERPYQLEDRVEQLFHEKSVTSRAWHRLFDETLASLRFKVDGEELAIEPTLNLLQDEREARRHAAAEALAETFRANLRLFTLITNTLAKDKEITDRWRGFPDVAFARHLSNRVEPEVVEALVAAVRAAFPRLSHRYYALKAKWFGKTRLPHWDRNAPLPKAKTRTIDWAEARSTVLDAYAKFSPQMAEIAERFFAKNWIDAPVRPGKAPGAFAHPTVPSVHPYVLLNYQGKPRDVMTLAHELGHGVHQVLAAPNGALTAERLGEIWREVQGESLGPAIELKPGYETFWTYIPHFIHSPFYVYAYAFGDCLVTSLYAVYERSEAGFAARYLDMLAAGGTKHHAELLAPFGLDARDPSFWQGGLSVIERLIDELEALEPAA